MKQFICYNSKTKQKEIYWLPKWVDIGGIYGVNNELTVLSKLKGNKEANKLFNNTKEGG